MKRCTGCGIDKPLAEFHRDARKPGGVRARCKDCLAVYNAAHRGTYRDQEGARRAPGPGEQIAQVNA